MTAAVIASAQTQEKDFFTFLGKNSPKIGEGTSSFSKKYTPSGSKWAAKLDEKDVFLASLKHSEKKDNSWEVRIGKGGQLYSFRGVFGVPDHGVFASGLRAD